MSVADEIEKFNQLRKEGAITDEEYQRVKDSLLGGKRSAGEKMSDALDKVSADVNRWSMFIHFSQFCGFILPLFGMIVPIVLWQIKKDTSEIIDKHGRIVVNWIITEIILAILLIPLCFVLIGIPLLIALGILCILFPIIGGVKANNGEVWPYPGSIRFLRIDWMS